MRATGQTPVIDRAVAGKHRRRLAAARAILGEWLGGSGRLARFGRALAGHEIDQGMLAEPGDPEFGISRGRLLPSHKILDLTDAPAEARQKLQDSLVLVHGGMAQNVGPILEMVTEKYLLRSEVAWQGRHEAMRVLDEILLALRAGDIRAIGQATTRNFFGPLQSIIPWASNFYTETLITKVQAEFGERFWGFWMLGGMSGGGMGFIFAPDRKAAGQDRLRAFMQETKHDLQSALPFAMDPVVYDFAINQAGTMADLLPEAEALLPPGYYALIVPDLIRADVRKLPPMKR